MRLFPTSPYAWDGAERTCEACHKAPGRLHNPMDSRAAVSGLARRGGVRCPAELLARNH